MSNEICVISGIFPPESGGPAKFAFTFSNWLIKNGKKVSIITLTDGTSDLIYDDGIQIRRISRKLNLVFRCLLTSIFIRKKSKSKALIIANGCFIETWVAFFFTKRAYIAKVPGDIVWERAYISNSTTLNLTEYQKSKMQFKYKVFRHIYSQSLKRANHVIVPTYELRNVCINWGVPSSKISVIYNSVSSEIFLPLVLVKKFDVITISRLVPWKNINELIICCSELGLSLVIVGDGPEMTNLKNIALKFKTKVTFYGNVAQSELPIILNSAKVFVLNSSYEASSYALLEARSCGLVSIARTNTGSEEVIRNGIDGLLINEGQGINLQYCLKKSFSSEFNYRKYSQAAVDRTRELFDMNINYRKIYKIIKVSK